MKFKNKFEEEDGMCKFNQKKEIDMREWCIQNFIEIEKGILPEELANKFFELLNENYETSPLLQESFRIAMQRLGKND